MRLAPAVSTELGTRTRGFGTELGTGYSLHCTACSIGQLWKSSPLHRMQVFTFLYRIPTVRCMIVAPVSLLPTVAVPVSILLSGRLIDSLVVYPEHHFLDAVDQSLDGA